MLTESVPDTFSQVGHKIERSATEATQTLPAQAISLAVLKAIEQRLVERRLLQPHSGGLPLWFLAETERNTYLWRNRRSLSEQDRYEFWIDIERLIEKRKQDLAVAPGKDHLALEEEQYLNQLAELLVKIGSHAHALSQVGLILEKEMTQGPSGRARIVLPARPR